MRTCANYLSTVKDVVVSISDMKKSRYACGLCEKTYAHKWYFWEKRMMFLHMIHKGHIL